MKRVLLLTTIGVLFSVAISQAQNVFNPSDPIIRLDRNQPLGAPQHPDSSIQGLQKWVTTATQGVSFGTNNFDASSFKAYFINLNGLMMPFRIKFPRSYNNPDSAGKKYPIMVFFHGAGEPGCRTNGGLSNNEKQLLHGGKLFRDYVDQNKFDGFLFYPQLFINNTQCWSAWGVPPASPNHLAVIAMIDSVAKYARGDVDRVITTGLSDGGAAAWNMGTVYPQRVAKMAPSAAASGATNFLDFVHIPIWFASGGKDTNPTPGFASGTYNSIKNQGADITYTLFPDLGHSVWYQHWQLEGFTAWMNDMHKANPLVYFQRNDFCPDSTINTKIGITRGFYEYEWQRDNITIATAVSTGGNNYSTTIVQPAHVISYTANDITVRSYGTYRVRFRRTNGGAWSPWSPKPAVIFPKTITITPPIAMNQVDGLRSKVLPAPDGSTTVPLELPLGYNGYQWYRNEVLVSTDRTIQAIPGSYKAKVLESFGCGSIFSPNFNVVSANSEPKPDPATNLTAVVENSDNVRLNWNQNPNAGENETGFEIYRSPGSGGPYTLIHITGPDVSTYLDENLQSNTNFYYVVRSVGNFGAGANTNEANAHTPVDNIPPSPPSNLTAVCITRTKVTLNWTPATDNSGVAVYDIYVNGVKSYSTPNTRFEIFERSPQTTYNFAVRAKDQTGNTSQPSNQLTVWTKSQGVCYKVFQGDWETLPDFNNMVPVKEGMSPVPDLSVRPAGVNDNFGILWEGYVHRTVATNNHVFQVCSDDGSRFWFNGFYNPNSLGTIDNDGVHTENCISSGTVQLTSNNNHYPIALAYFEQTGGEVLRLRWSINGGAITDVPATAFSQTEVPGGALPNAPTTFTATAVSYSQINLSWNDNNTNETGYEVVRASASGGPYSPLATITGATTFQDTGLNASTQYWYKVRTLSPNGESAFFTAAGVSATTQAPPPGPNAPTNLNANSPALATVNLTWNDNSTNEAGFEIWRSSGNNTNYQLLATIPGGGGSTKNYVDAPVFANVHYFYKVRAAGSPTPSGYTGEATISTANTAPVLLQLSDFTVRQGTSVSVNIDASDVDGDPLTFSAPSLPYFATIQPISNGHAQIVANPPAGEQGAYTLRLYVDDGFGGRDTIRFTMVVNDNYLPQLNNISDIIIDEGDSVSIPLVATDAEMTQNMLWSFKNKPSFVTFTNEGNGNGTLKVKPWYAHSGIYQMTVIVDDGFGAWTSRTFNIIVNEADPNETIQVNMRYFTGFVPLWNDVPLAGQSTFNVANLVNKKGQTTTAGIRLLSTQGPINASDAGMQPGGIGVYPDAIMKDQLKVGYNGGTDQAVIQVYGLDPTKRYNFIFFASDNGNEAWRGFDANTVTTYSINGNTAQVHVWQNINETDTIYQVQPNASGQVNITMTGDTKPLIGALLNALVIDAQVDDGTLPAKPQNLNAQVIPNVGVKLTWNDIAYNETSYRIYRSTSPTGPFTQLTPDALKDSITYLDPSVAPYSHYYYFVRGVHNLGLGTSSDTVSAITGNNKPSINSLADMFVKTGATGEEDFSVSDNVEDVITVTILNKPRFITLSSLGGGNYRITAVPTIDDIGFHYITVQATDNNGGLATQQVAVQVADAGTRSIFVNFAYNVPAPAPWNNLMGYGNVNTTLSNLRDEQNTVTPFAMTLLDGWDDVTDRGHRTGNNSGVFPDSVLAGGIVDYGTADLRIRFSGLNNAMRYNISLVGSHNEGLSSIASYESGTVSASLQARNNTNATANLNNLTPVNGEIIVTINRTSDDTRTNNDYTVLNGIQVEEYAPLSPSTLPMGPINLYVEGRPSTANTNNLNNVILMWTDRSSNETGFQIQRATDSLFTQNLQTSNPSANATSHTSGVASSNMSSNTRYWWRIRAVGPGTNNFSAWSNKVSYITPATMIYVNFNFSVDDQGAPWNNTNALPNFTNTFNSLLNHSNQPSGVSLAIEKIFNGEYAFGPRTGNNSGIVPDNVLQASYWIDRSQVATMRLSGLNTSRRYRIGFTGSIDNALFSGDMTMTYTVNGRTVYLNSMFNTTKMVWIGDIVPDVNGEILLEFSTPNKTSIVYGFTSGIIVQSYTDNIGGQVLNSVNQPTGTEVTLQTPREGVPQVSLREESGIETSMYPNPFVDQINLDFNNTSAGNNVGVDVYDLTGRLVYRRNYGRMPAGYNTLRLNTAEGKLNVGVYMVTLTVNGKPVTSTKMIKDRK